MSAPMTPDQRLAAYERMHAAILADYDRTSQKMADLKAQGKEKSATYRQLFASRLTLTALLTYYQTYGLDDPAANEK